MYWLVSIADVSLLYNIFIYHLGKAALNVSHKSSAYGSLMFVVVQFALIRHVELADELA